MTEAEEIAWNIADTLDEKPTTWEGAVQAVTKFMGTPDEVGHQLHDNVAAALLSQSF